MLLWVMGVGFENTCTVSEKINFGLFQDCMHEIRIRVPLVKAEHGVNCWLAI